MSTALASTIAHDGLKWHARWGVHKFDVADFSTLRGRRGGLDAVARPEFASIIAAGIKPYEVIEDEGNLLLNNGINRLLNLLIGTGSIAAYATSGAGQMRIGAGDGSTAVTAADTDLSAVAGSTHRWFNKSDASNPTVSAQTLTCVSTFASADGNFAWNEWGVDGGGSTSGNTVGTNSSTTSALLNRKVPGSSLGTKASGASWAFTITITIS